MAPPHPTSEGYSDIHYAQSDPSDTLRIYSGNHVVDDPQLSGGWLSLERQPALTGHDAWDGDHTDQDKEPHNITFHNAADFSEALANLIRVAETAFGPAAVDAGLLAAGRPILRNNVVNQSFTTLPEAKLGKIKSVFSDEEIKLLKAAAKRERTLQLLEGAGEKVTILDEEDREALFALIDREIDREEPSDPSDSDDSNDTGNDSNADKIEDLLKKILKKPQKPPFPPFEPFQPWSPDPPFPGGPYTIRD